MTLFRRGTCALCAGLMLWAIAAVPVLAQGAPRAPGLVNPNTVGESELQQLPGMATTIVKSLTEQRPFKSIVELNKFLLDQKLTAAQARDFYRKAFVPINLNTGTRDEFMLIPGRRLAYGGGICRIPAVEDLGAVRQGNRQICRPAGDRPLQAICDPASELIDLLDVLDKELEKRGHHFVRYADDCNIYVRRQRAGERVMTSIELFLTKHLKLTVNKAKAPLPRRRC